MRLNSFEQANKFELTGGLALDKEYFQVINPFFFNFFKRTSAPNEIVEPVPGVTIEWLEDERRPRISVDNPRINQDSLLFVQVYGDQMVEVIE